MMEWSLPVISNELFEGEGEVKINSKAAIVLQHHRLGHNQLLDIKQ